LNLRIDELNDAEIYHGLRTAHIPNVENVFREIVSNSRISQLARVPLFLWELAAAAQSNRSLPRTRFELLHRSVLRASQEHEEFLTIAAFVTWLRDFFSALARSMSDASVTVLSGVQARQIVADIQRGCRRRRFCPSPLLRRLFSNN